MTDDTTIELLPKQQEFLASDADVCLFGGTAGPGKTYGLIVDALGLKTQPDEYGDIPLSMIEHPHYRGLIIRRQYKHLRDIIDKTKSLYNLVDPGAVYLESRNTWQFSSGATILFLAIEDRSDADVLQGQEYQWIGIDECGQYPTSEVLLYCLSRLRSSKGLKCYLRGTSNPSKYPWLKKMFRIQPTGTSTYNVRQMDLPGGGKYNISFEYIQAFAKDNPHLGDDYQARLSLLPEDERLALQEGRWDSYTSRDGQVYQHELDRMDKESRCCRVPHSPLHKTYVYWDLGIFDNMVCLFVQFVGKEIHIIDKIEANNIPVTDFIPAIKTIAKTKGYDIDGHYLPHDGNRRNVSDGASVYDVLSKAYPNVTVLKIMEVEDAIRATKILFQDLWIDSGCSVIDHLREYKRKFNPLTGIYEKPIHDIHSHLADAVRYISYDRPTMYQTAKIRRHGYHQSAF